MKTRSVHVPNFLLILYLNLRASKLLTFRFLTFFLKVLLLKL
jgi:hypothetical protein